MEIFEQFYYGNKLIDWIISLGIILGAFVLNKLIVLFNKHVLQKLAGKTNSRLDDILFQMLESPVLLGVALFAIWIAAQRLNLGRQVEDIIAKAFKMLIVINITWFVSRFGNALIEEYLQPSDDGHPDNRKLDTHLVSIIRRSLMMVIWSVGVVMALNNVGVNVGTLIAGLGIGGIAFGLGAQTTIKNLFGGITIITDRPFKIGERIKVDNFDGFVEDIGIRSTRIRTLEKRLVTIPNYKMMEVAVENITREPAKRMLVKLSLNYKTTLEQMNKALEILRAIPTLVEHVSPNDVSATFSDFGTSGLTITYVYYVEKSGDVMQTPSEVNFEILKAFKAENIEFAFPTHTIQIEK
jgi:MscS family membrane protein